MRAFFRRLWYPDAVSVAPATVDPAPAAPAASVAVTVAVRSPSKKRPRSPMAQPSSAGGDAALPRRSKRGIADPNGAASVPYCTPDEMTKGTERIAAAHQVMFEVDDPELLLRVSFPPPKRGGSKGARRCEEYYWIPSKEELRNRIALEGYANEGATLLALAMEEPMLFWNAVYWCDGNVERIEQEILVL